MTLPLPNNMARAAALMLAVLLALLGCQTRWPQTAQPAGRTPVLYPDYGDTVVAPNIAPLNLQIKEPGVRFRARLSGENGGEIEVQTSDGAVRWPAGPWRRLLERNRGASVALAITARHADGNCRSYLPVRFRVAREELDRFVVYRLIPPVDHYYTNIGIYQRDLEDFSERPVVENQNFAPARAGCVNCHSFRQRRTDRMSLQIRSSSAGRPMVVVKDGVVRTVDTSASGFSKSPAAYHDWHPDGRRIVYSVNTVMPLEHTIGEHRDVWDEDSDLAVYDTETNRVETNRGIADPQRRESWPSWSSDGRTLYFVSAPQLPWTKLADVRYDLMRISYNPATGAWGRPESLLSAALSGRSAAQPKESPDGRRLVVTLADHGTFPTYQPTADLYLIDLDTGNWKPLAALNSPWSDSWHCWSSNGRWIAFASKRDGGLLARIYFSYFDADGNAHKPFVMPQEDPDYYERCTLTYNVPELTVEPVPVSPSRLGRSIAAGPLLPAPSLVKN